MDIGTVGAVIGVVVALVKIVDTLVGVIVKKLVPPEPVKLSPEHSALITEVVNMSRATLKVTKETFDMHNKYDEDGRPKWFVPHSLMDRQEEIIEKMNMLLYSDNTMHKNIDDIEDRLEDIEGQLTAIHAAIDKCNE